MQERVSKCMDSKPIALSLIPNLQKSMSFKSGTVPTIKDLFSKKYLNFTYPELLKVCNDVKVELSKEQMKAVERDTRSQAKGNKLFKHRYGTSLSKQHAKHTLPCPLCPLFNQFATLNYTSTKAVRHGCKHEKDAINVHDNAMIEEHVDSKQVKCGLIINEECPQLHASPDFLCSCDCCGKG